LNRLLFRICIVIISLVILLLLAAPLMLYQWGLSNVDGRPQRPTHMASTAEQARIWKQAGGAEPAVVEPINPYGFFVRFFVDSYRETASERAAYWIARSYLPEHRRGSTMLEWHGGVAALTIWITRNWSTEEILTVAAETVSADPKAPLKTPRQE